MTTVCVVQARMGSTRLPGKVMADLGGRPMLAFMLERLRPLRVDRLVVATSTCARDDVVVDLCDELGVAAVRGSELDVLERFATVIDAFPCEVVVRLTGDCPLVDPELVEAALRLREARGADYASNTLVRTFPDGLDVEVLTAAALAAAAKEATEEPEREHVTPFVYRHPERFGLASMRQARLLGGERWTVDTTEDLELVRSIVAGLGGRCTFGWEEALRAIGTRSSRPPGDVCLRVAATGDAASMETLVASGALVWTGWPFGPGELASLLDRHDEEPSTRIWAVEQAGELVGAVVVAVRSGLGRLTAAVRSGAGSGAVIASALGQLQLALRAECQVTELVTSATGDFAVAELLQAAGFVSRAPGHRWRNTGCP